MKSAVRYPVLVACAICLAVGCTPGSSGPETIGSPVFSIPGGLYDSSIEIEIACPVTDASIRYTTDGADPTTSSGAVYSGPFELGYSATLKAIAYRGASSVSEVKAENYWIRSRDLDCVMRDFTPSTNEDFEYSAITMETGIVNGILGDDGVPVYAHSGGTATVHSPESFHQWFHDTEGVNIRLGYSLPLTEIAPGYWAYRANDFFPIDGEGFGNTPGYPHNYHFTMECRSHFMYEDGEAVSFYLFANDDSWLFVNGRLAVDMGGISGTKSDYVLIDSLNKHLFGIEGSGVYRIDIFHAQRHTTTSTFHFETDATLLEMFDE